MLGVAISLFQAEQQASTMAPFRPTGAPPQLSKRKPIRRLLSAADLCPGR
jgi:hypothetical protein